MTVSKVIEVDDGSENWFYRMTQQLSGVTVVIIIAAGVLTFLLLFIFAKRQIMRFTLRSHRGPHACIGLDANKALRREILRRIDALQKITYEPRVLREDASQFPNKETAPKPCHYFRMKAVDDAKNLELEILKKKLGKRQSFESLRSYFIVTLTPQVDPRVVHQFCDMYEAARFNPKPFFEDDYKAFTQLLQQLRSAVTVLQPRSSVRSPSKGMKSTGNPTITSTSTTTSGSTTINLSVPSQIEEKGPFEALAAPYIRKIKRDKSKWTSSSREEEQALCDSSNVHEISIISSAKDESTAV